VVKEYTDYLSDIDDVLAEVRRGRPVILLDDDGRENEGDLVLPAAAVTPEWINFMAQYGRGLICLALTRTRAEALDLPAMERRHVDETMCAFTVSIEARHGITTGISAADRARTIQVAADPASGADAIATPGHIFPVVAREGGVLVRAGHTEAAVDIARLAGYPPAGAICEILREDGTMARLPDLVAFAQFHNLKLATVAKLIDYRCRRDPMMSLIETVDLAVAAGPPRRLLHYRDDVTGLEHAAVVVGDPTAGPPPLVRVETHDPVRELMAVLGNGSDTAFAPSAATVLDAMASHGAGVLVRLAVPTARPAGQSAEPLRGYGTGARILRDLDVHHMVLLGDEERPLTALTGFGIRIDERRPLGQLQVTTTGA
jgi:3,4-dihydroxy 2-butanone 4-phosphate synthase/GTP cyclohydrolase II